MAFSRLLRNLVRDPQVGPRIVPIIPDEARTFGLDPLFKEIGIYNPLGQRYTPVDKELLLSYLEKEDGQILEEGITEAGAMADFTAAGTSYATHGEPMIPFYIFYSMFGFQRTGDFAWAFGDARGRGFMLGATAGRTTLTGEGLQHDDGHSHLLASTIPNVIAYDPAFAYELAIIVREGIRRMYGEGQEDVFYYVTLYNENWPMPALSRGRRGGRDPRGLYRYRAANRRRSRRCSCSPPAPSSSRRCAPRQLLAEKYDVAADVWSATSFQQLRNDALDVERWNRLHPEQDQRVPYVVEQLRGTRWADRRRHRLHEGRARHDLALGGSLLHGPRHGRLRTQRHARGAADALRGECRAHRLRGTPRSLPVGPGQSRGAGARHRRAAASTPNG